MNLFVKCTSRDNGNTSSEILFGSDKGLTLNPGWFLYLTTWYISFLPLSAKYISKSGLDNAHCVSVISCMPVGHSHLTESFPDFKHKWEHWFFSLKHGFDTIKWLRWHCAKLHRDFWYRRDFWHEENYNEHCTKMKFFIMGFFSKCNQIHIFIRIWSHLLNKSSMENFIFWVVKSDVITVLESLWIAEATITKICRQANIIWERV